MGSGKSEQDNIGTEMLRTPRPMLTDLNPLLTCALCEGYLIDATTLTECLHSFCRSCLVRYFHTTEKCPTCDTLVHKSRPLLNARPDKALQSIVYKAVPGLFKDEMKKRRDYYTEPPVVDCSKPVSSGELEEREEADDRAIVIHTDDEYMNLSLEYHLPIDGANSADETSIEDESNVKRPVADVIDDMSCDDEIHVRYLRCPAAVRVKQIRKLIKHKFDLKPEYQIQITHADNDKDPLSDEYTLMDVAYIYEWRRIGPLPLVFKVFQDTRKRLKTNHIPLPNRTMDIVDNSFFPESETSTSPETAAAPTIHEITSDVVIKREREGNISVKGRNVINIIGSGSYKVSPEVSLTERQLLPKLRIPMMNIFQMTTEMHERTEDTTRTKIEDSDEPISKGDEELESKDEGVDLIENNERRLLLQKIVKEKIKESLLKVASNNNEKPIANDNEEQNPGAGDSLMQYNSEETPINTTDKLSYPVVSVR